MPKIDHGTGDNTLIHGEGLTSAYANQTVIGKYNADKADALFIVGNGTADNTRSNALEVLSDGNVRANSLTAEVVNAYGCLSTSEIDAVYARIQTLNVKELQRDGTPIKYAGSDSVGGAATSAKKLTMDVKPISFIL